MEQKYHEARIKRGAEIWKITEKNVKKVEAIDMYAIRRSMGISRKYRVINKERKFFKS